MIESNEAAKPSTRFCMRRGGVAGLKRIYIVNFLSCLPGVKASEFYGVPMSFSPAILGQSQEIGAIGDQIFCLFPKEKASSSSLEVPPCRTLLAMSGKF